jgi:hypothetical protein
MEYGEKHMRYEMRSFVKSAFWCLAALVLLFMTSGCSRPSEPAAKKAAAARQSGFLKDYAKLKADPKLEDTVLAYVAADPKMALRNYVGVVVDPVDVYLATDADASKVPALGMEAISKYFHHALVKAVGDVYPVVQQPGPLVMRLRAAVVGVDAGSEIPASGKAEDAKNALTRAVNVNRAYIELELTDSVTGEVLAAAVDKATLAAGSEVGSPTFSRDEKYAAARLAFDAWASRVRNFLDAANDLPPEDALKRIRSYQPYGN